MRTGYQLTGGQHVFAAPSTTVRRLDQTLDGLGDQRVDDARRDAIMARWDQRATAGGGGRSSRRASPTSA